MFKLSPYRALVKWFLASVDVVCEFFCLDFGRHRVASGTNLCMLVQTSLIGLLVVALHLVAFVGAVWFIFVRPFQKYGWDTVYTVGGAILIVGFFIGIWKPLRMVFSSWSVRRQHRRRQREIAQYWERVDNAGEEPVPAPVPAEPSFAALVWEWLVAVKKRICPTITWAEPISENKSHIGKLTLTFGQFISVVGVLAVIGIVVHLIPYVVLSAKANFSVIEETSCTFTEAGARASGDRAIQVSLLCGQIQAWSEQRSVVVYLLNNPKSQPLACSIYGDNEAWCRLPEN